MKYRPEIDGLRALAIIPVIFFHAGISTFSGGYVGVDVFFVISGYLITSILLFDIQKERFSFKSFYERRARRLLPALYLVMLVCLPFSWLMLTATDLKSFAQSIVAVSLFSSNFLFHLQTGYFDLASELKPLLHTWSLAVEEQFYIIFPLFLLAVRKVKGKKFLSLLILVALASFWYSQSSVIEAPTVSFFMLPSRLWELLVGSIAACLLMEERYIRLSDLINQILSLVGVGLIVTAVFLFDEGTLFPGGAALIPVLGSLLVILFATPNTLTYKILSQRLFVFIGLISYSAYLWHQPIFAFFKYQSFFNPSSLQMFGLSLSIFPISYISWKYVEEPFRCRTRLSSKMVLVLSIMFTTSFVSIGIWGHLNHGFPERFKKPPNLTWISLGDKIEQIGRVCSDEPNAKYPSLLTCEFGDLTSVKTIAVYGDSHADALMYKLDEHFTKNNIKGIRVSLTKCGVIPTIQKLPVKDPVKYRKKCQDAFGDMLTYLEESSNAVILSARWTTMYYPAAPHVESLPFDNQSGGIERIQYRENVTIGSDGKLSINAAEKKHATLSMLRGLGDKLVAAVVYPVPEIGWDIYRENVSYYDETGNVLEHLSYPYSVYKSRNEFSIDILDEASLASRNIIPIRADTLLCQDIVKMQCVAQYQSVPYYVDDDHLSDAGADIIVSQILKQLSDELESK